MSNPAHHGESGPRRLENPQGDTDPCTNRKPASPRLLRYLESVSLEPRHYAFNCRPRQVRALVVEDNTEAAILSRDPRRQARLWLAINAKVELLERRQTANRKRRAQVERLLVRDGYPDHWRQEANRLDAAWHRRWHGLEALRVCRGKLDRAAEERREAKG